MDNDMSLAAQAVAAGPQTVASPSFDGHGWLVVLNMAAMTAATVIGLMTIGFILRQAWAGRIGDRGLAPARLWRVIGLLFASGITLRCGAEAMALWGWDARDPIGTAFYLTAKRFIDPVAVTCGVSGLCLLVMSMPGMVEQLRKEPLPIDMWQSWDVVKRMLWVALLALIAAAGVVSTR